MDNEVRTFTIKTEKGAEPLIIKNKRRRDAFKAVAKRSISERKALIKQLNTQITIRNIFITMSILQAIFIGLFI